MQLPQRFFDVLHGEQPHRIKPLVDLAVALRYIVVKRVANPGRVVRLLKNPTDNPSDGINTASLTLAFSKNATQSSPEPLRSLLASTRGRRGVSTSPVLPTLRG